MNTSQSMYSTSEARLNNFMRLEPSFRHLNISFNSNMVRISYWFDGSYTPVSYEYFTVAILSALPRLILSWQRSMEQLLDWCIRSLLLCTGKRLHYTLSYIHGKVMCELLEGTFGQSVNWVSEEREIQIGTDWINFVSRSECSLLNVHCVIRWYLHLTY